MLGLKLNYISKRWLHVSTLVNIRPGNGLLQNGTKPLSELVLRSLGFLGNNLKTIDKKCSMYILLKCTWIWTPHPLPTKTYTTLVPKFAKHPLFAEFGRKKHPFFNRNRWFRGPIKHPFLSKTRFFRNIIYSNLFWSENICNCIKLQTFFYVRRIFHYL